MAEMVLLRAKAERLHYNPELDKGRKRNWGHLVKSNDGSTAGLVGLFSLRGLPWHVLKWDWAVVEAP